MQRIERRAARAVDAVEEAAIGGVMVHQEADRAAIDAVKRQLHFHVIVQRLQHESVAAEHDDHLRAHAPLGDFHDIVMLADFLEGRLEALGVSRRQRRRF